MSRPRLPTSVLELRGSFKKHQNRRKAREGEPKNSGPLGEPPERMDEAEKARWLELAEQMPWLGKSDRAALEMAAKQMAKIIRDGGKAADFGVLRGYLSDLGGMAGSRSKVKVPEAPKKGNPFQELMA